MNLSSLLSEDRVDWHPDASSKKRALEVLSGLLSSAAPGLEPNDVFESLLARERLGATGLGRGVAIPHGRLAGVAQPSIAMIKLNTGVEFDAPDKQPVDLLFALIVPDESSEEHLEILSLLAEMLHEEQFLSQLRGLESRDALYSFIAGWHPDHP
ncbi:MAG TPA: PTS sugar transporter subunit IIA [Gammaproteobacteria bacterium]|nr:PTS sugar transporter subunit IIA [Gammaproteobacteria bacterium]